MMDRKGNHAMNESSIMPEWRDKTVAVSEGMAWQDLHQIHGASMTCSSRRCMWHDNMIWSCHAG